VTIRHVVPVARKAATGRVAAVYTQSLTDFGQAAFMMLSPVPEVQAATWALLREAELVGRAPRVSKEVVAVGAHRRRRHHRSGASMSPAVTGSIVVVGGYGAVLSLGVAPGLTNLLARHVHQTLGGADRLDITVLLGAGEHHGLDAVGWTVRQLGERFPHQARSQRVALAGYGNRAAHVAQQIVTGTLPTGVHHIEQLPALTDIPLSSSNTASRSGRPTHSNQPPDTVAAATVTRC
jgi:hypothetical protein